MQYGRMALVTAALVIPVTVSAGNLLTWSLKTRNPDDVDITAGLAYLRPILLTSFGAFVALAVLCVVLAVLGMRRDDDPALARLSLALLATVTVLGLVAGLAASRAGDAEDRYRTQNPAATG